MINADQKYLQNSNDLLLKKPVIVIHGPMKQGKTVFAASASKHFPDRDLSEPFQGSEMDRLDDMLWLCMDRGALDGFPSMGLEVPYAIDMRSALADEDVLQGRKLVLDLARKVCEREPIEWVVMDTVSAYDKALTEYWDRYAPLAKNKETGEMEVDTQSLYREVLNGHMRLYESLMALNVGVIGVFHSNFYDAKRSTQSAKKTKELQALPGTGDEYRVDITGKGRNLWMGDQSTCFAVKAELLPSRGSKLRFGHFAYPFGDGSYEGGTRIPIDLERKMPARLGEILKRQGRKA